MLAPLPRVAVYFLCRVRTGMHVTAELARLMIEQLLQFAQNHPLLVGAFVALLVALIVMETMRGNHGVSVSEATRLVNREEGVFIDIRDSKEYKAGHIAGAVNVPSSQLASATTPLDKYKDRPVIIVCKHGQTAGPLVARLEKAGFKQAVKLKGGMGQWEADSLPVVTR